MQFYAVPLNMEAVSRQEVVKGLAADASFPWQAAKLPPLKTLKVPFSWKKDAAMCPSLASSYSYGSCRDESMICWQMCPHVAAVQPDS